MRTHPQNDARLSSLAAMLDDMRVGMLTLGEPANGLCSRPMTALEMDASGVIWFMASRKTTEALLGNGAQPVNLSFCDLDASNYVSIAGRAKMNDDIERKRELWSPMARPWFDSADDADLTLIEVSAGHVEIWDGPDNAVSRVFAIAASVVAGREVGMGDKTVLDIDSARL